MRSLSLRTIGSEALLRHALPDGSFSGTTGGQFQTDSTAWGILALAACGGSAELLDQSRHLLMREQLPDGRLCVDRTHPASYWPTPLAVLAWQDSEPCREAQQRAVRFLLETTGFHFPRTSDVPSAHDTLIKGWPWVGDTHSWVEPTAIGIMALKTTGHGHHDRAKEAVRMVLDRQLPHGGWNYGNTHVFGRELHPMPESTGAALTGLTGLVERDAVRESLTYLQHKVTSLRTPISLGWSLLGLAAWNESPANVAALVERCLANQERYGEYETSALCLLVLGALASEMGGQVPLISASMYQGRPAALTQ
ncbi:prenyltransferase/squalene oxidase repeat-containing protein [Nitrospira sp. BLG_1]|uniref:prenyltransferase/squalene oxidase repeat-containing protein n=1 Tax=Nitrospira sp. BLG_1 TaxID=3395883 RepID=UPI0039BC7C6E